MQIAGIFSRSRGEYLAAASFFTNFHPILSRSLGSSRAPHLVSPSPLQSTISNIFGPTSGCERAYHYGRPRGSLWRVKKEIRKEALFVILGMKRLRYDAEKLDKFIKTHVRRLLKLDMVAVLNEVEGQEEVFFAVKVNYQMESYIEKHRDYIVVEHGKLLASSRCPYIGCLVPPLSEESSRSIYKFLLVASGFKDIEVEA